MFIMKLQEEMFNKIKSGNKYYEARVNDEKRQRVKVGDTIIFKKLPDLIDGVVTKVVDVKRFDSFEQMARVVNLAGIGFENKDAIEISKYYRKFYSEAEEKEFGVVVFKLELY